jgi:hypothetical protein
MSAASSLMKPGLHAGIVDLHLGNHSRQFQKTREKIFGRGSVM